MRIFVFILCLGSVLNAQAQHYLSFNYTCDEGLSTNHVRHVAHDSMHYLWVATDNGLLRFNGYEFTSFSSDIPSRYIRNIVTWKDQLICSHDAGLSSIMIDDVLGPRISTFEIDAPLVYPDQLLVSPQEDLWISQQKGPLIRMSHSGQIASYDVGMAGHNKNDILLTSTSSGVVWIANRKGQLYRYNPAADSVILIQRFPRIDDLKSYDDGLWITSAGSLIHLSLGPHNSILKTDTYTIPGTCSKIGIGDNGQIFLGIDEHGMYLFDLDDEKVQITKLFGNNDPHRVEELPFRHFYDIVVDGGHIWVCSEEGLGLLQHRFFESVRGVPNAGVTTIVPHLERDVLINIGEIYRASATGHGYDGRSISPDVKGAITCLALDDSESIIFATSLGMLYTQPNNSENYRTLADLRYRGEGIFNIMIDDRNNLWICQAPSDKPIVGVAKLDNHNVVHEYGIDKGLESRILAIKEDESGKIHAAGIGKKSYLYRYIPEQDEFINLSVPFDFYVSPNFEVHDFDLDDHGVIWLATTDGLLRQEGDRIFKIPLGPTYEQTEIRAIVSMPDGSLWLSTDTYGLLYYHDGHILKVGEESGLPSKIMSYRALSVDPSGRLWVGTEEGLVYSRERYPKPLYTPQPYLSSITVDEESREIDDLAIYPDQKMVISIDYPAFHGYRSFYSYRLHPEDRWQDMSDRGTLILDDLSVGRHSLELRTKREGPWYWSVPMQIPIVVVEHWYEIRGLWYALILCLISGMILYFLRKRRKYKRKIAKLHEELTFERDLQNQGHGDVY